MRKLNKTLIACAIGLGLAGGVNAFSFSVDDDDGYYAPYATPGWGGPGWGPGYYNPWVAPPTGFWYPPLPSYDRSQMKRGRQRRMDNFDDAMNELRDMLYGGADFERTRAIQIARKIEATSGHALTGNFHPGSVVTTGSRTTTALWGNEEAFKANAEALRLSAGALADELAKRPTEEQGAVYLSKRSEEYGRKKDYEEVPVSPQIWKKFNALSDTCVACHSAFRGRGWW